MTFLSSIRRVAELSCGLSSFEREHEFRMLALSRESRLDLMRGYAMLAIALNHVSMLLEPLGFTQQNVPTLTAFGYSSAASLFFALSGYMIGLVYLRRPFMTNAIWKRVRLIYLVNAAAFAAGLLIVANQPARVQESLGHFAIFESGVAGLFLFLAMLRQPALLDVLHMYVILMLATPLVAILLTRQPLIALLISAGIYLGALLLPAFAFPAAVLDSSGAWHLRGVWNMEILSWQLLFFAAMYAGTLKLHVRLFAWLEENATVRWTIILLYGLLAAFKLGDLLDFWGTPPLVDKRNLEPLRILHAGLTILLLATISVKLGLYLSHPVAKLVELVGRQTLYGFAASIPATYLVASLWFVRGGYVAYLLACVFVLATVILVACLMEARNDRRSAKPA
jgi:hypothetical protein